MREMGWTWQELQNTPAVVVEQVWAYMQEEAKHREEEMRRMEREMRRRL